MLGLIKDEYPEDENVILVPESRVPYEVIVLTSTKVDGSPRTLFPFVVIAGGAQ